MALMAWAGDTWIANRNAAELEAMVADLRAVSSKRAGLELRVPKSTWSPVERREQGAPELRAAEEAHPNLTAMTRLSPGQRLCVQGTFVKCDRDKHQEFSDMLEAGWRAYHAKTFLAHHRPSSVYGARSASQRLPRVDWVCGRKGADIGRADGLHSPTGMHGPQGARLVAETSKGGREYARRTASLAEHVRTSAKGLCWSEATAGLWWKWAGHAGRPDADRLASRTRQREHVKPTG